MSHHLRSCATCQRHIRISETACPFCGASVPASRRTPPERGRPAQRIRRAAALASLAVAGTASPLVACSSDNNNVRDAAVGTDAAYGGPPPVDFDAEADAPTAVAAYGAPEVIDAAADAPTTDAADGGPPVVEPEDAAYDATTAADASGGAQSPDASDAADDVVSAVPLYGLARPWDGSADN